jgi:hypothetical protein
MKNKQKILLIFAIFTLLIVNMPNAYSATFGVGVNICVPDWYCTAYDQGDCGSRTCIDTNSCGSDYGKPTEYLQCEEQGGGGGGGSPSPSNNIVEKINLPDGYFTISFNSIKISLEENKVEQKIIKVNSSSDKEYLFNIQYPSSYLGTKEFLTTTSSKKYIEGVGDFNLIIDTRGVSVGTYVVPIIISNNKNSKEITVTIDVVPEKNAISEILLDTKIKTIGIDTEFEIFIETRGDNLNIGDKIEYSIIDPKGNKLYSIEETITDTKNIRQKIPISPELKEGYYTVSAKVENSNGVYVNSAQFTLLTPNKYYPITQKPKNINLFNIIISIILAVIIGIIIHNKLYADTLSARKLRSEINWRKENMRTQIIDLKIRDKLKKITSKFIRKDKKDTSNKAELLKQSYEKGHISLKEYNDALNSEGYHVGQYSGAKLETPKEAIPTHQEHHNKDHKYREEKPELKEEKKHENHEEKIEEKKTHDIKKSEEKPKDEVINVKELLKYVKEEETRHIIEDPKPKHEIPKEKILENRTHNQAFILNNGVTLHSMGDLLRALDYMPHDVFAHHTANGRNDFATWIWDVFRYGDIAEDVRSAKTKEDLIRVLKKYE